MSIKAETLKRLHLTGKVTEEGLRRAVNDGVITQEEYNEITEETA